MASFYKNPKHSWKQNDIYDTFALALNSTRFLALVLLCGAVIAANLAGNPDLSNQSSSELVSEAVTTVNSNDDPEPVPYNSPSNKISLYSSQNGICNGCKFPFLLRNLEVDHIHAQSRGGSDFISNLQLLCGFCNRVKGPRPMDYLIERLDTHHRLPSAEVEAHIRRVNQLEGSSPINFFQQVIRWFISMGAFLHQAGNQPVPAQPDQAPE